jgi:hypothetical protein
MASTVYLSKAIGKSKRQTYRYLKILESKGLITRETSKLCHDVRKNKLYKLRTIRVSPKVKVHPQRAEVFRLTFDEAIHGRTRNRLLKELVEGKFSTLNMEGETVVEVAANTVDTTANAVATLVAPPVVENVAEAPRLIEIQRPNSTTSEMVMFTPKAFKSKPVVSAICNIDAIKPIENELALQKPPPQLKITKRPVIIAVEDEIAPKKTIKEPVIKTSKTESDFDPRFDDDPDFWAGTGKYAPKKSAREIKEEENSFRELFELDIELARMTVKGTEKGSVKFRVAEEVLENERLAKHAKEAEEFRKMAEEFEILETKRQEKEAATNRALVDKYMEGYVSPEERFAIEMQKKINDDLAASGCTQQEIEEINRDLEAEREAANKIAFERGYDYYTGHKIKGMTPASATQLFGDDLDYLAQVEANRYREVIKMEEEGPAEENYWEDRAEILAGNSKVVNGEYILTIYINGQMPYDMPLWNYVPWDNKSRNFDKYLYFMKKAGKI